MVSREFGVLLWELSEVQIIYYKVQSGPHPFTLSVGLRGGGLENKLQCAQAEGRSLYKEAALEAAGDVVFPRGQF